MTENIKNSILEKNNLLINENKLFDITKLNSISPSEIVVFEECPYKWKLIYQDKVSKFETNINFLFGKAAHEAIQSAFMHKNIEKVQDFYEIFSKYLEKEKSNLKKEDLDKVDELIIDAHSIFDNFDISNIIDIDKIEEVKIEEKIVENFNKNWLFSGRLDIIFKIENKIHIWDIKTSKSSWRIDKRGNIAVLSQPILYKFFWAKKHNVSDKLRDISTAFLILKKKAVENNHIELFKVPSGPKSIERCIKNMKYFINCIENKTFLKSYNKYVCKWCEFNNTEYCPGDKSF